MRAVFVATLTAVFLLAMAPGWRAWAAEVKGTIDLRITDHRPGIDDFRRLDVTLAALALHRKGAGRRSGWVDLTGVFEAVDIVPLKDGLWRPLAAVRVPAGDYDALRVRFAHAGGQLLTGGRPEVRTDDTVVRFDLTVAAEGLHPLVLDLFAEDLTDHEPQLYIVRVKEVRADRPGDRPIVGGGS